MQEAVVEAGADDQHHRGHDQQVEAGRRQRAAAAEAAGGPATSAMLAASAISTGWKTSWNCGTPKPNSSWSVDRPISVAPASWTSHASSVSRRVVRAARRAAALDQQQPGGDRGQRGAADHQHVGRAPERDVLAEDAVPDVVEREAEHGHRAAQQQQRAAERHAPARGQRERRAVAVVGAEHAGQEAGQRDAAEPEQDRVVGDVGERPGVAPVVDVRGDVPEEAEAAMPSEPSVTSTGSAAQPGTGITRSARPARRVSSVTRPDRCVAPSTSAAAVSSPATIAAGTRSCTGAPPAGSPAAKSWIRSVVITSLTSYRR